MENTSIVDDLAVTKKSTIEGFQCIGLRLRQLALYTGVSIYCTPIYRIVTILVPYLAGDKNGYYLDNIVGMIGLSRSSQSFCSVRDLTVSAFNFLLMKRVVMIPA